jgi:hypothetical protein
MEVGTASSKIYCMAFIVQMCWYDSDRDIRRYPAVLEGILERLQAPLAEYVFLDTTEQAQKLLERIAKHIPAGHEPYVSTIFAGPGGARKLWTAMITPA